MAGEVERFFGKWVRKPDDFYFEICSDMAEPEGVKNHVSI